MSYALNLNFGSLQASAEKAGLYSNEWKDLVLQDLLHKGELFGCEEWDPKESAYIYRFYGRRVTALVTPDKNFANTLFVIGLFDGPTNGGRARPQHARKVPGPWTIRTANSRAAPGQRSVREHLAEVFGPRAPVSTSRPAPRTSTGGATSRGADPQSPDRRTAALGERTADPGPPGEGASRAPDLGDSLSARVEAPASSAQQEPGPAEEPLSWLEAGRQWAGARHPELSEYLSQPDPEAALAERRRELAAELARITRTLEELPDENRLREVSADIRELAESIPSGVNAPAAPLARTDSLREHVDVIRFLTGPTFDALPGWAREALGGPNSLTHLLCNDVQVQEVQEVRRWVIATFEAGPPPTALGTLPVGEGAGVVAQLEAGWQRHARRAELLMPWAGALEVEALGKAPLEQLEELTARLSFWQRELPPPLFASSLAALTGSGVVSWLDGPDPAWFSALSGEHQNLIRTQSLWSSVQMLQGVLPASGAPSGTPRSLPAAPPRPTPGTGALLGLAHAVSGESGKVETPLLVLPAVTPDTQYFLRLPIRARASQALAEELTLTIQVPHLNSAPVGTHTPDGGVVVAEDQRRVLRRQIGASSDDWERASEPDVWHLDLVVTLPVFKQTLQQWIGQAQALALELTVELAHGDRRVRQTMTFSRFSTAPQALVLPERDTTDSPTMTRAPLGVQEGYETLEPWAEEGQKSFLVAAPRRFGKTTLLHHLLQKARQRDVNFVFHVALNRSMSPAEAMRTVLDDIRAEVKARFGVEPDMPWEGAGVPPARTFTQLRKLLGEKGVQRVIVLVDEAQALVPRRDGGAWGTALKNLIENHLARGNDELPTVALALFGTSSLAVRLGDNCRNFLRGKEVYSFTEPSLTRFLRTHSGAVQSTAAARTRLAEVANNLWTLLELLRELGKILKEDGRAFFVSSDVNEAVRRLLNRNLAEPNSPLWSYVSAELNQIDEGWEPIDAYPVALALASDELASARGVELRSKVVSWLEGHLQASGLKVTIPLERVEQGLEELRRVHILSPKGDAQFQRALLKALLRQRAEEAPFRGPPDEAALFRLAVESVPWDPDAQPRDEGGQASVYVSVQDGRPRALRRTELPGPTDRTRFMRACAALRALEDPRSGLRGDEHLPRIRGAGLQQDDPNVGLLVYDWVEGEALDKLPPGLPALARAHVVMQVALALEALHGRGIVHRDVHPRNVVIDGALKATLIDFGLACLVGSGSRTRAGSPAYHAPELQEGGEASPAADVFALGVLLRGTGEQVQDQPSALRHLADRMTERSAEARPQAAEVVRELSKILGEHRFRADETLPKQEVEDLLLSAEPGWLLDALMPFQEELVVVKCGYMTWSQQRALSLAHLLNTTFCAFVQHAEAEDAQLLRDLQWGRQGGQDPSLAALPSALREVSGKLSRWKALELEQVGNLRNAYAHPGDRKRKLEEVGRKVGNRKDPHFEPLLRQVALLLDQAYGTKVIVPIVELFTAAPRPPRPPAHRAR